VLAVFSAFGYFNIKAAFIDFFCNVLKGLFGYGTGCSPMLAAAAYILAFHRAAPYVCAFGALLFPVVAGGILHVFPRSGVYEWDWAYQSPLERRSWAEKRGSGQRVYFHGSGKSLQQARGADRPVFEAPCFF
jgi:S-DNA-T family DNA segregation ATPase FtsK/SpoIIIE